MIGGTMLLCAVGAMLVLAMWSLKRDEHPDAQPRDGLLALRSFGEAPRKATKTTRRYRHASAHRNRTPQAPPPPQFDPEEMAEIAAEAEATLPQFVHDARHKY